MSDTIDEALDLLAGTGPEYTGGLSNHGPMAAEALIALGRSDAAIPWVEGYRPRLFPPARTVTAVSRENWREALGDYNRVGDWIAFFDRELAEHPWREVLDCWVRWLAPAAISSAMHGLIRTAHAARSLGARQTPQRTKELAQGLGYWAATYLLLPDGTPEATGTLSPSQAIAQIERPLHPREIAGSITDGLTHLDSSPSFTGVSALVDTRGEPAAFISDLTRTFASIYLANAHDLLSTIIFIHSITGPSAIRLLLPHLSDDASALLLRHGWQSAAALYTAFAAAPAAEPLEPCNESWDDLIERAVTTGDEHAIKFTEACLREDRLAPQPIYAAAVRDAIIRLS